MKNRFAVIILLLCALIMGCTEAAVPAQESSPSPEAAAPVQESSPSPEPSPAAEITVPENKTESYLFSGTWTSDDEQTVVPVLVHLYDDGTLVLEAHENRDGNWMENEDGSIDLVIGGVSYTAKYSETLHSVFFRYTDQIGDETFSVQMTPYTDPAKVAEQNNQTMIDHIRSTESEEPYEGEGGEVIFYGGSNFQKWTSLETDLAGYPVVNKSIGGSNDPIRREFIEERVYSRKPAVVFYMSSSNDWTSGQDKEEIRAYKEEMFNEMAVRLPDTVFVILSATPNPLRYFGEYHDGMIYVDAWTKGYCAEKPNFEFLDVVPALSLDGGQQMNPDLWQSDKLHLNEEGYSILAGLVREELHMIEENYPVTFSAYEEPEDDGEEQRLGWARDWTEFAGWADEPFVEKEASYQLTGHWEMTEGMSMEFFFLANLYADGSLRITQYSPTRGQFEYYGYWTQRDTEKGNRITLTTVCETPINGEGDLVPHAYTYRIYEENGTYSFSYDFGIVPGSYMRAADLTGSAEIRYASAQDLQAAE